MHIHMVIHDLRSQSPPGIYTCIHIENTGLESICIFILIGCVYLFSICTHIGLDVYIENTQLQSCILTEYAVNTMRTQ